MINFKLFGMPITVQPFFFLILAMFGGAFDLLNGFTTAKFLLVIVFIIAGFISILIHELGHALMMKKYGRHPEIILHGFGGVAISSGIPFTKKQSILVTAMGPLAQLILSGLAFGILKLMEGKFPTDQSFYFVHSLWFVSWYWALLNLIPIFPLDGGQLLSAFMGPRRQKDVHLTGIVLAGLIIAGLIYLLITTGHLQIFALVILAMLIMDNIKALERYK